MIHRVSNVIRDGNKKRLQFFIILIILGTFCLSSHSVSVIFSTRKLDENDSPSLPQPRRLEENESSVQNSSGSTGGEEVNASKVGDTPQDNVAAQESSVGIEGNGISAETSSNSEEVKAEAQEQSEKKDSNEENNRNDEIDSPEQQQSMLGEKQGTAEEQQQGISEEQQQEVSEQEQKQQESSVEEQHQDFGEQSKLTASDENSVGDIDNANGGGSSFAVGVGFVALILVGALLWFRRMKRNEDRSDNNRSGIMNDFGLSSGSESQGFSKSETVPLAAASDDEEWGWEDSSQAKNCGEMELIGKNKEDNDLTMAFSMQSNTNAPSSIMTKVKNSPTISRRTSPPLSTFRGSSSNTKSSGAGVAPMMQITSLGKSSSNIMKKKKKKQDDDLFASMGLAAKPTFSSSKLKLKTSSPATGLTPKISALAATDFNATSADWDDDGDLDDLLND